jgi:hypothetical protein
MRIDPKKYINNEIKKGLTKGKHLNFVFEELSILPEESAFKIIPEIGSDGEYLIRIVHQIKAFDDKVASVNLASFYNKLQTENTLMFFMIFLR